MLEDCSARVFHHLQKTLSGMDLAYAPMLLVGCCVAASVMMSYTVRARICAKILMGLSVSSVASLWEGSEQVLV